jgi:hypothetical protein
VAISERVADDDDDMTIGKEREEEGADSKDGDD